MNKNHININRINDKIDKAIAIPMEYPYLEDKNYCDSWDGNYLGDEKKFAIIIIVALFII